MSLPPPSLGRLALGWSLEPVSALLVVAAAGVYALGVRRLAGRGRRWPPGRSVAFAGGLAVVAAATQSGLARYDSSLFSAHAAQHVLLGMVGPMLLALGAPVTLALQAGSARVAAGVRRVVHGPVVAVVTHPVAGLALVGGSLFALYFTPLLRLSLASEVVHAAVHAHFLAAGCAFFWPVLGLDVGRRRLPHGLRMLAVLALVPLHAILGIAILSSRTLLAGGWYAGAAAAGGTSALADQGVGGGVLWTTGDLVGVVAAAVVLAQWMRHDEREAAREDRRLDLLTARPAGDEPG